MKLVLRRFLAGAFVVAGVLSAVALLIVWSTTPRSGASGRFAEISPWLVVPVLGMCSLAIWLVHQGKRRSWLGASIIAWMVGIMAAVWGGRGMGNVASKSLCGAATLLCIFLAITALTQLAKPNATERTLDAASPGTDPAGEEENPFL